jgi:prepilin-type N-terminal cleavage/methylation domain-containing protein
MNTNQRQHTYRGVKSSLSQQANFGFTLIEVMIAMAIFTTLITIGMGAVLNAMQQHAMSQNNRTVMDSLNFAMEDMARNIRLGANFRCESYIDSDVYDATTDLVTPQDCPTSGPILLFNDYQGKLLKYTVLATHAVDKKSENTIGGGLSSPAESIITPSEVVVDIAKSGFSVRSALPSTSGDTGQPTIMIKLVGTITSQGVTSNFSLQTTVTPRALDS